MKYKNESVDQIMSVGQAHDLFKHVRRRYRTNPNKQRIRMQYCDRFAMAERSFYRKIRDNSFTAHELRYLAAILDKKKGKK